MTAPRQKTAPCACHRCDRRSEAEFRGYNRKDPVGLGAYSIKAVPAGSPARVKLLDSLGLRKTAKDCGAPHATAPKGQSCCTWANLLWGNQHHLNKAHFTPTQLRYTQSSTTFGSATLKTDAVADVAFQTIWADNALRRNLASRVGAVAAAVLQSSPSPQAAFVQFTNPQAAKRARSAGPGSRGRGSGRAPAVRATSHSPARAPRTSGTQAAKRARSSSAGPDSPPRTSGTRSFARSPASPLSGSSKRGLGGATRESTPATPPRPKGCPFLYTVTKEDDPATTAHFWSQADVASHLSCVQSWVAHACDHNHPVNGWSITKEKMPHLATTSKRAPHLATSTPSPPRASSRSFLSPSNTIFRPVQQAGASPVNEVRMAAEAKRREHAEALERLNARIHELESLEEDRRARGAESDAPMSVSRLETDPHIRAAVRQYTSFYSHKSFQAWLKLMNVHGRMAGVNPGTVAHPPLGHDAGLYTTDQSPVHEGVWCETINALELEPDNTDPHLMELEADTLVQVIRDPVAKGAPNPDAPLPEEVWVQMRDGTRGKVPRANLLPLSPDQAREAHTEEYRTGRKRATTWDNALFFVLYVLRTGSDKSDAAPLFHLRYSTACRYFVVYLQALKSVLASEFPYPSLEMIKNATPEAFKKHFPGRTIQEIIDAHEQEMQVPSCLVAQRSTWSKYKHRQTAKFLGGCTPCGAMVSACEPRGGSCNDRKLTQVSGILSRLHRGCSTLADKGFLMHSDFADALHELITPCKAYNKQATFTIDETIITTTVARDRALVERVFRRGQEWKYLHRTIPITETDIAGSCFFVIMMMTNYEPVMARAKGVPLISTAETQWPVDSYKR